MDTICTANFAKMAIEYIFNMSEFRQLSRLDNHRIFLFLSPQYLNYGDHAIAFAELDYIRKAFPKNKVIDINYSLFQYWPDKVKASIQPDDIIIITGGGFMGNLWPENQALVEKVITYFPENRIVFAPQTLYFKDTVDTQNEKERFTEKLRQHGNFFFFARDKYSCDQMSQLGFLYGKDFDLMPDFVLLLPRIIDIELHSGNAAICMRKDAEALDGVREKAEELLIATIQGRINSITMAVDHVEIPVLLRKKMLQFKMQQFANASIVVTDRLHGMLFAAYTGTPCVVLDNISKKVSGVHQWIQDLDYIAITDDVSQIPELLSRILKMPKEDNCKAFCARQKELSTKYLPQFASQLE